MCIVDVCNSAFAPGSPVLATGPSKPTPDMRCIYTACHRRTCYHKRRRATLHSHPMRQLERQKSTRRCLQALSRLRSLTCDRPIVGRDFQELGYLYNVRHAISVSGRCLHLEAFQTIILYASTNAPFLFKVHIIL